MRRFVAVCVALLPVGCTLLSGVADLEAVSPADAGSTADVTRSDGTVSPTGPDGSSAETGSEGTEAGPDEGGVDAGLDADATADTGSPDVVVPPTAFCKSQPASVDLCFDYDTQSIPPAAVQVNNGSTLSVDGPGKDSANALHCVGQDDTVVQCLYVANAPASPTKVRWGFDVRLDEAAGYAEFNELEMTYEVGRCMLQPTLNNGTLYVNEFCPSQGAPDQVNHEIGTIDTVASKTGWYTFTIEADYKAGTLNGTIKKPNGTSVAFGPITLDKRNISSAHVELHPGLDFSPAQTPAAKLRTDNVWLDAQ